MKKIRIVTSILTKKVCNIRLCKSCRLPILPILSILLVLMALSGCSSCTDGGNYNFKTRHEALREYDRYLEKVRSITHTNTKDFGQTLCEWHEISDTIYKFLAK